MNSSRPPLNRTDCLLCGETDVTLLTLEHIIPQTLWNRFGIDPNGSGDVRKTHTTLCEACNGATSRLHQRSEMLDLLETGTPVTDTTLRQVADWIFWVLLLLHYSRGDKVIPPEVAHKLLHDRFVSRTTGALPRGWRIYAARTTTLASSGASPRTRYDVVTAHNTGRRTNGAGRLIGLAFGTSRSVQAALTVGIGKLIFLILPPTEQSGPNHLDRVDAAARENGLERIQPLRGTAPTLPMVTVDVHRVRDIFLNPFEGDDHTLLPESLRALLLDYSVED